jgi:hypothetical protein
MVVARRRRRRPVLPLFAALVTVVVVASALAGRSTEGPDSRLGWLDRIRPAVERSNRVGAELTDLRARLQSGGQEPLGRQALDRRLGRLSKEARAILRAVSGADAPSDLDGAAGLVVATMALRSRAVDALVDALHRALGSAPAATAIDGLVEVGLDLGTADRNYDVFLRSLPRLDQPVTVRSRWLAIPEAWERPELTSFVAVVRNATSLAPVHDVSVVTVTLDPPPTGCEGDADVVPATGGLRLQVVVANVGNEIERRVTVLAVVALPDGTEDTARQFVDLAPGQRQTVQLGGLRAVRDLPVALRVRAEPVAAEANVADNDWTRTLIFR